MNSSSLPSVTAASPADSCPGLRDAGQQHEHRDTENVLDDQNAEHELREAFAFESEIGQRLHDDRRRRDREDRAEEQRVHRSPAERAADLIADPQHQHDFGQRGDDRRRADLEQLAQAEFEAQRKHQEHDAQLAERLDRLFVVDQLERRRVRSDDHAGRDIAEHHRLLQAMEQHGDDAGQRHHDGQILDEADAMVHERLPYKQ
ncbi:hypothetical protein OKW40_002360 [Paraburkholderia sp. RAU6.4a]